jgi:hypothetical protein
MKYISNYKYKTDENAGNFASFFSYFDGNDMDLLSKFSTPHWLFLRSISYN